MQSPFSRLVPRRGGIISGLFFAVLVCFCAVFVAGVFVSRTVRVRSTDMRNGTDVSIDTPGGRLNIRARDHMDPSMAGVPVYPGAWRVKDGGGANIEWDSDTGGDRTLTVVGGEYRTKDSLPRVVEFYRNQLSNLLIVSEGRRAMRLEYKDGTIKRIIAIHEENGETRIGVASIAGRESN